MHSNITKPSASSLTPSDGASSDCGDGVSLCTGDVIPQNSPGLVQALSLYRKELDDYNLTLTDMRQSAKGVVWYATGGEENMEFVIPINSKHERALAHDPDAKGIFKKSPNEQKQKMENGVERPAGFGLL